VDTRAILPVSRLASIAHTILPSLSNNPQNKRLTNLPHPLRLSDMVPQPPMSLLLTPPHRPRHLPLRLALRLVRAAQ